MKVRMISSLILFLVGLLILTSPAPGQRGEMAVKAGKIYPVAADPIENGVILIRDGKITAMGRNLNIPLNARVIDAGDKVVIPGLVLAHSSRGMDQENERNPEVPFTSVLDAIDTTQVYFDDCRRNGISSIAIVPGNNTRISSQAAVIKTRGKFVWDMVLKGSAGIKISLSPTQGQSRMSHRNVIRNSLKEAQDYLKELQKKTGTDAQPDIRREAMCQLLTGQIPAFIYIPEPMDAVFALDIVKEFNLKAILVLGRDCYKAVDLLAKSSLPVILDEQLVFWERNERTDEEKQVVLPKIFREAGIIHTFQARSGSPTGTLIGTNFFWYQAATAMKYGATESEALAAITLVPAQILGVDKFVGSLEVGKDADLVILSGEPLQLGSWVETVLVDGEVAYDFNEDTQLQNLLNLKDKLELSQRIGSLVESHPRNLLNQTATDPLISTTIVRQIKEMAVKK